MDDPLLVEVQAEDYWYEGYNMRTGARGIFPAYYAIEVAKDTEKYKGTDAAVYHCTAALSPRSQFVVYCIDGRRK